MRYIFAWFVIGLFSINGIKTGIQNNDVFEIGLNSFCLGICIVFILIKTFTKA